MEFKIFFKGGWLGFQKSYVIFRVGHGKGLRLITRWVGGVKKGQKRAYVILEWSVKELNIYHSLSLPVMLSNGVKPLKNILPILIRK